MNIKGLYNAKVALCLLLEIGAALRIAELWLPLTHDELSAICRLQFSTFAELLTEGVKYGDTHPAGVQVFMWLWCHCFGTEAPVVRLPFVLMGIACIPLVYSIAKQWYGQRPALLAAAAMALSQYAIYYSMLARPYVAGLFFLLLALLAWSRALLDRQLRWPWLLAFAFSAAACAYCHYFCALTAFFLGLAGLPFAGRKGLGKWLLSCALAMILFLPHLGITLHQLTGQGGVGDWLPAPDGYFVSGYFSYLNHHSLTMVIVAAVCWLAMFSWRAFVKHGWLMLTALILFVLPFATGYFYSVHCNPVLQFSTLIFSWPFLLLTMAGTINDAPHSMRTDAALVVYSIALTVTLFVPRRHYDVASREWIETSVALMQESRQQYGASNVECLINEMPDKLAYYDTTVHSRLNGVDPSTSWLDSLLSASSCDYVVTAKLWDDREEVVRWHYPYRIQNLQCVSTDVNLYSRIPDGAMPDESHEILSDTLGKNCIGADYVTLFDVNLADVCDDYFVQLVAELDFAEVDSNTQGLRLVMEIWRGSRRVAWREASTDGPRRTTDGGYGISIPVSMQDFVKKPSNLRRCHVKAYLWNPQADTAIHPLAYRLISRPSSHYTLAVLQPL